MLLMNSERFALLLAENLEGGSVQVIVCFCSSDFQVILLTFLPPIMCHP